MIKSVLCVGASAVLALGLFGCGTKDAATVNGEALSEEDVTHYVEQLRTSWGVEDDDENWAYYLGTYGYTPGTIRDAAIDALAQKMVIEQKASELGVSVSDEDVNAEIQETRDTLGYTDDVAWAEALTSAGYADEQEYADAVKSSLLQDALCEQEVERTEATDDEVESYASSVAGERASHILVDSEETANEIAETINASEDKDAAFAEALSQTLDIGDDALGDENGDLGWTAVNYEVYYYTLTNTATALEEMSVGDVQVVSESDGYHVIYCTDKFEVPEDTTDVSLDDMPEDLVTDVKEMIDESNYSSACSEYVSDLVEEADIETNDFPKNMSYDVDMSSYIEVGEDDGTGQQTTDSSTGSTLYFVDDTGLYYYKVIEDEDSDSSDSSSDSSSDASSADESSEESEEVVTEKTYVSYATTAASYEDAADESSDSSTDSSSESSSDDSSEGTAVELQTDDQGTYYTDSNGNKVYLDESSSEDSSSADASGDDTASQDSTSTEDSSAGEASSE